MSYKKFAQELYAVANQLDAIGKRGLADKVDGIAEQLAKSAAPSITSTTMDADGRSVDMLISPEESNAIRGVGGNPGAVDANRRLVQEGTAFTERGELSPRAIKEGFSGPIEVDGDLFAYKYDGAGMKDSVTLYGLRNVNIGIGDATASLPVIRDMSANGTPLSYAVKPAGEGDAKMWMLDRSANDPSKKKGSWFSHFGEDMQSRYLSRMKAAIPGFSIGGAPALPKRPVVTPGAKRGFAGVASMILGVVASAAAMLGLKGTPEDYALKDELDILKEVLKRQEGRDPASVKRLSENARKRIKDIRSKIGQPGYQINADQAAILSKLESSLHGAEG